MFALFYCFQFVFYSAVLILLPCSIVVGFIKLFHIGQRFDFQVSNVRRMYMFVNYYFNFRCVFYLLCCIFHPICCIFYQLCCILRGPVLIIFWVRMCFSLACLCVSSSSGRIQISNATPFRCASNLQTCFSLIIIGCEVYMRWG